MTFTSAIDGLRGVHSISIGAISIERCFKDAAANLRQSVSHDATQNPDEYAKVLAQAARTGKVPARAKDFEPEIKQPEQVGRIDFDHFVGNAPKTSALASNPDNAAKAPTHELVRARKACDETRDRELPRAIFKSRYDAAFLGLVPIPLGWLAVYGLIALVRWIVNGFKGPKHPEADHSPKNA